MLGSLRRSLQKSGGSKGHRARPGRWRDLSGLLAVAAIVLVISTVLVVRGRRHAASVPEPSSTAAPLPTTADTKWDEKWPRLAITGFPARPLDEIRAAYAFAARRPDVLQSIPCFCGCKRQGHENNEACYVKSRSSAGVPRWTDHGITCGICIDITRVAIVMTVDKQPIDAIRVAIGTKYR